MRLGRPARLGVGLGVMAATMALGAAPVLAHDCFNPTKTPTAGVNYTITGFDPTTGPTFVQTGPGQGNGGFTAIAPGVFGNDQTLYVHSLGSGNNPHEVVGGPGSQKPNHACDGKGIDFLDACGSGS